MTFVPEWPVIVQFAVATFIIAVTPGPDMTLFVGRAIAEGRAAGMACMLGAMSGIVVHTTLVALGLSALILASPEVFLVLKMAGAGYLVWLAWQAITKGSAFSPDTARRAPRPLLRNWATGLAINLLNPKIILFFMTFLPQFVSANDPRAPGQLFFLGLLFIPLCVAVTTPLVIAADRLAGLLGRSPRATRILDWLLAGVFSAFAVKIITAQAK